MLALAGVLHPAAEVPLKHACLVHVGEKHSSHYCKAVRDAVSVYEENSKFNLFTDHKLATFANAFRRKWNLQPPS